MNPTTARFLLDECLGRPIVEPLSQLIAMGKGEKPVIEHVLNLTASGTRDEVWIPQIARDGWTVITGDGGRTPNKQRGEKLPNLCARYGVTHVILSSAVHQRTAFERLLTVLSVWYQMTDIANDPSARGNRYDLQPNLSNARGIGRVVKRDIPPELLLLREKYLQSFRSSPDEQDRVLNP